MTIAVAQRGIVATVSVDTIVDAMICAAKALAPIDPQTELDIDHPLRQVDRYIGAELIDPQFFARGVAGRCPAARVRFAGTRGVRRTIGRRVDRVESMFEVVMIDDSHEAEDRRKRLSSATESVRQVIAARKFALPIDPIRFTGIKPLRDDMQCLAYVLTFSTRHRTNYTIDPGVDVMESVSGTIFDASATAEVPPKTQGVAITFPNPESP